MDPESVQGTLSDRLGLREYTLKGTPIQQRETCTQIFKGNLEQPIHQLACFFGGTEDTRELEPT